MPLPEKRIANLIYFLGGRTAFSATAKRLGHTVSLNTIGSWVTRNSLPAKHTATCNAVAKAHGTPINWSKVFS
jgi:fructose-specific phosphotransferase system component IIB